MAGEPMIGGGPVATIELWHRAQTLREISSTLASRDVAALLEQYAAEMDGVAAHDGRFDQARREYERIASFN